MKILSVIGSINPITGGPCQGLRNIIPEMKNHNIHNEVVTLDDPTAPFIGNDPFIVHALGPNKGMWKYTNKLKPWLIENISRFDIVIIHGLWLYHGYAVRKAYNYVTEEYRKKEVEKIPKLFVMCHGMLDPYFQRAPERRLKAIRNWFYWKLIESKIINQADGVLFTCEEELLLARQTFRPYQPKKEMNVGYGIEEPPALTPSMRNGFIEKCKQLKNDPFILFISRINEKKGIDLLIEAYKSLIEKGNDLPKLVIAGPGLDTKYGAELLELVNASTNLKNNVFFPGMLTGDAKWGAFYSCEAFILPSHQENFGIAVVEALACSKAVLISNQINIWREIEAGKGGIIKADTLSGSKELLTDWLQLSDERKREMGENARIVYEQNFHIKPAVKKFLEAIS